MIVDAELKIEVGGFVNCALSSGSIRELGGLRRRRSRRRNCRSSPRARSPCDGNWRGSA